MHSIFIPMPYEVGSLDLRLTFLSQDGCLASTPFWFYGICNPVRRPCIGILTGLELLVQGR